MQKGVNHGKALDPRNFDKFYQNLADLGSFKDNLKGISDEFDMIGQPFCVFTKHNAQFVHSIVVHTGSVNLKCVTR